MLSVHCILPFGVASLAEQSGHALCEEPSPRQINIVRNWTEELKARVPTE